MSPASRGHFCPAVNETRRGTTWVISLLRLLFAARRGALTRITSVLRWWYEVHQRKSLWILLHSVSRARALFFLNFGKREIFFRYHMKFNKKGSRWIFFYFYYKRGILYFQFFRFKFLPLSTVEIWKYNWRKNIWSDVSEWECEGKTWDNSCMKRERKIEPKRRDREDKTARSQSIISRRRKIKPAAHNPSVIPNTFGAPRANYFSSQLRPIITAVAHPPVLTNPLFLSFFSLSLTHSHTHTHTHTQLVLPPSRGIKTGVP